jgi:RHS repeat-associated protein
MIIPNRNGNSPAYRYGFQGQEKDDEIKGGSGNSLNYTFRMHDPRVGRFFAVDPLTHKYPHYTPYSFSGNKVIQFVELEGLEEGVSGSLSANANVSVSVTLGAKNKSNFRFGFGGSIMANISYNAAAAQVSFNGSLMYTNGGLTASGGNSSSLSNGMFESIFSPAVTIGALEKNTPLTSVNYLHGNATTALQNTMKYSFMWALNYHNGTDNRDQRTATYGVRIGAFTLNILEDHKAWYGADKDDKYFTGSFNANWLFPNGSVATFGSDVYTGNSKNDESTPKKLGDTEYGGKTGWPFGGNPFYWANQNQIDTSMGLIQGFNQSLNNAQTYLQLRTSSDLFRLTTTGPASFWSQTTIHNAFSPAFHHFKSADSKNRIELTIGK